MGKQIASHNEISITSWLYRLHSCSPALGAFTVSATLALMIFENGFGAAFLPIGGFTSRWQTALHWTFVVWISTNVWSSYLLAMFVGPGQLDPSRGVLESESGGWCGICNATKPPRAHHCSKCRRCSLRMDHHCHFINNCVGQANQRHFYLYLVFLEMAVLYCLLLAVPSWWALKQTCAGSAPDPSTQPQHHWFGLGLFLLVDNLTAGCTDDNRQNAFIMSGLICVAGFTLVLVGGLLRQQTSNLRKGVTYIEQLKAEKRAVPNGSRFSERGLGNVWRLLCTTEMDSDATCCRFWVLVPDLWTWYGLLVRITRTQKVSL